MQRLIEKFKEGNPGVWGLAILLALVIFAVAASARKAKADDQSKLLSGCSLGGFGSHLAGLAVPDGSPVGLGAQGQMLGVSLGCDVPLAGTKLILGGEVSYAWMFGDLADIGVDTDLSLTGRVGYALSSTVMPYAHAGWSRLDASGTNIDGYKVGLGAEMRVPGQPVYFDVRWSHGMWDVPGVSGIDVTTDEFRAGLKIKLGPGMFESEAPKKVKP